MVCVTSSSSSVFPAVSLGFTILGEILASVTIKKTQNLTIEVVTFRLHGWCMLGMWSESFESVQYVHRLDLSLYSHLEEFLGNGVLGGRKSSLVVFGLAVHSVAGSILLWGKFPVEGIFPLKLTWVRTPFPPKLFQMRV